MDRRAGPERDRHLASVHSPCRPHGRRDSVVMTAATPRLKDARFAPTFGERGELRQKIGTSGRAHLDRWLPFLVLNRSAAPAESIARRVAINSPAYLIWSPDDDPAAAEALQAIA